MYTFWGLSQNSSLKQRFSSFNPWSSGVQSIVSEVSTGAQVELSGPFCLTLVKVLKAVTLYYLLKFHKEPAIWFPPTDQETESNNFLPDHKQLASFSAYLELPPEALDKESCLSSQETEGVLSLVMSFEGRSGTASDWQLEEVHTIP